MARSGRAIASGIPGSPAPLPTSAQRPCDRVDSGKAGLGDIRETAGDRKTYVTLDIDATDPAFAPGTGTPEPGGFSSYQMLQLMRGLKGLDLVGMDIVEVSPPYDHADVTAILAANLVFEYLCLVALNRA